MKLMMSSTSSSLSGHIWMAQWQDLWCWMFYNLQKLACRSAFLDLYSMVFGCSTPTKISVQGFQGVCIMTDWIINLYAPINRSEQLSTFSCLFHALLMDNKKNSNHFCL